MVINKHEMPVTSQKQTFDLGLPMPLTGNVNLNASSGDCKFCGTCCVSLTLYMNYIDN